MSFTLEATSRQGNAAELRKEGRIPAVVYGPHIEAFSIAVPYTAFEKLFQQTGESSIIALTVDGKDTHDVLVKDMQFDPVKGSISHVDFRQITAGEEIDVSISLEFVGEALAEKQLGGTLMKNMEEVVASCMPADLVDSIEVDLSVLATFDDTITVADIVLPPGITLKEDPHGLVAKVIAPMTDDQFKAMEESGSVSVEDIKVEEKGKAPVEGADKE